MKKGALQFFNSDNGQISYARIIGTVIILTKLVEGVLAFAFGSATTPQDIPVNWLGLVVGLYGLNKFGTKGAPIDESTP